MLNDSEIDAIINMANTFWNEKLSDRNFNLSMFDKAKGKEGGHQISDLVDQLTTEHILCTYPLGSGYQHDSAGGRSTRSMGDIWIKNSLGEWHPVNVKTGLVGSEGQPNIVSLKKVLSNVISHSIDSYYLLIIKFEVNDKTKSVCHHVHFVDMLDWLCMPRGQEVITYDDGPGQMMLKANKFFECLKNGMMPSKSTICDKVELMMEMLDDGFKRIMKNREKTKKELLEKYKIFKNESEQFSINQEKQLAFNIQ